ncbi:chromosome partition protein Smc [Alicyclobacillus cellulosilyticus]|uniref:Chromosome partition protein Smc n=1 Tax=Alicyclobacillus cellulosilyticus TaxID=1003997 RepID=A0A917KBD6_9BACL|nr:chromosome segregation protein SMC [Alicyclobacillus cellulosilyticus]GGJ07973.1 chromosome partition protein Smc [Alicyclobacillus cellulosilyticus]
MYLKRIEIHGFKSFADRTTLELSPGITAIVGPNGSGKSNIADAIRWVLGEQNARSLRGNRMEDVIFAGSEGRRSVNFCEVSITLDNADRHLPVVFDEVRVTRRVYRSGESEYLINQQPCRLKDIHELFMDSGLGREAYSIIGQGRVEELLSTQPEDRRGPFEEAAGIVKFKTRRKETERRLEESAANLTRVDDILAELTAQAGPLAEEAARAMHYQEVAARLTAVEASLWVAEIDACRARWERAQAEASRWGEVRAEAAAELARLEQALAQAQAAFDAAHTAYERMQQEWMAQVEAREQAESTLARLRERLDHARRTHAERQEQAEVTRRELQECQEQLGEAQARAQVLLAQCEVKEAEQAALVQAQDVRTREQLAADIERWSAAVIEGHRKVSGLRNALQAAQEAVALDDKRRERAEQEVSRWRAALAEADQALSRLARERALAAEKMAALQADAEEVEKRRRQLQQAEARCAAEVSRLQAEAASLVARLDLLRDLAASYDGYQQGVRAVLQAAEQGKLRGVHGAIANLIQVPQAYETAIETALGAAVQNIVVATEADARAAIEWLKRQRAGRATFMPLDVVRGRQLAAKERQALAAAPGLVGVASELVRTEEVYRDVVNHLLGQVIVAETLVAANDLARRTGYRLRVVTLDGDVVHPGGMMSGGSQPSRRSGGLLGRAREQRDAQVELQGVEASLAAVRRDQERIRHEGTALFEQQQALSQELDAVRRQCAEIDLTEREWQARRRHAEDRLATLEWERMQANDEQHEAVAKAEETARALAAAEAELAAAEAEVAALRERLSAHDAKAAEQKELLTALQVELAALKQEARAWADKADELRQRQHRLQARVAEREAALAEALRLIAQTEADIAQAEETWAQAQTAVAEAEAQHQRLRQARQEAEAEVAERDRACRAQRSVLAEAEERWHRATAAAERLDMELQHALRTLGERYRMTYEWAKAHHPPPDDVESARREAAALRRELDAMGEVRLAAIDEWQRLSERIAYLERERTDLVQAREQLLTILGEIDREMARRFSETFEQIRQAFQVSFKQLFSGGRADLVLTRPDDPLATGIEVMAQPPGKKLQNLNLLSGGERALTAMALLFAILRVRPVPFCVLDEVEAALDEANVSRFAQQLRALAARTQFIVITHRRGTMEEADALYGVTMQEFGISTLVSVRLAEDADPETA